MRLLIPAAIAPVSGSVRSLSVLAFLLAIAGASSVSAQPFVERFTYTQEPALGFCPELDRVFRAEIAVEEGGDWVLEMSILELGDGSPPEPGCIETVHVPVADSCAREVPLPSRILTEEEVERISTTLGGVLSNLLPEPDPGCGAIDPCRIHVFALDGERVSDNPCSAPRLDFEQVGVVTDLLESLRRDGSAVANGDTNGDGARDISDAIYLLQHLFLGGPAPVEAPCGDVPRCAADRIALLQNGDVNGDRTRDVTDAISLLEWLFVAGAAPQPICSCEEPVACDACPSPGRCIPVAPGEYRCTSNLASCEEVRAAYQHIVGEYGRACIPDIGCHVLFGHCGISLGGCYHAVSRSVRQADLDALATRFQKLDGPDCFGPVCDCAPPPDGADCIEGACVAAR